VIRGYQQNQTIYCDVDATGDQLAVKFRSYSNGKTVNQYGVSEYASASTLFILEKVHNHGKDVLRTIWKEMTPSDSARPPPGVYFRPLARERDRITNSQTVE
jgi:hypothetical protein